MTIEQRGLNWFFNTYFHIGKGIWTSERWLKILLLFWGLYSSFGKKNSEVFSPCHPPLPLTEMKWKVWLKKEIFTPDKRYCPFCFMIVYKEAKFPFCNLSQLSVHICLSFCQSILQYILLSVCLPFCSSVCLSLFPFDCLAVLLSACLSFCFPSVCPSFCLFFCLSLK